MHNCTVHKKSFTILYFIPFFCDLVMGAVVITIPLVAIFLNASSITLGFLGFTSGAVFVSLCFIFAKLSERCQRRNFLLVGLFFYMLCSLVLCFSSRIYHLYLALALMGTGAAMLWPNLEAWIAELKTDRLLAQRMGFFNISWSIGQTVGPLVGGILFAVAMKLPFYVVFLISLVIFFVSLWRVPNFSLAEKTQHQSVGYLPQVPFYITISRVANFAVWFSLGIIRYIFPKLGVTLGISPSMLGFLLFILFLSQTLTFYGLGKIHLWQYNFFPLIFFQAVAISGFVMVFFSSSIAFFCIAFVCIGLGAGMTHTSSLFYSVNHPFQKGPSAAIHEIVLVMGAMLGPLTGGVVAENISLRSPYLLAVLVMGAAIVTQLLIRTHRYHWKQS